MSTLANLSSTATPGSASALTTARYIRDLEHVPYPEGVKRPQPSLNADAKGGKFLYEREFLLQFMPICTGRPENLHTLPEFDVERRVKLPSICEADFRTKRHGSRVALPPPTGHPSSAAGMNAGCLRGVSDGSAVLPETMRTERICTEHGSKQRNEASVMGAVYSDSIDSQSDLSALSREPAAYPPYFSKNTLQQLQLLDSDSHEIINRKIRALLNRLTSDNFDQISDVIILYANRSQNESDAHTVVQVSRLICESAVDGPGRPQIHARLCRKIIESLSPNVHNDTIRNHEGSLVTGGLLFRKYLLNRCQEEFESGQAVREATAETTASEAIPRAAANDDTEKHLEGTVGTQKTGRRPGHLQFIGELFMASMLTARIMHECIKTLLSNKDDPGEENIRSLCTLLMTAGQALDTPKARAHMDVYFSQMKDLVKSNCIAPQQRPMLEDVIELRERKWIPRSQATASTTFTGIHGTEQTQRGTGSRGRSIGMRSASTRHMLRGHTYS